MNDKRLADIERGLNGIERKVLAVVPMQEARNSNLIQQQLYREGKSIENKVLLGALNGLCVAGLVKRDTAGGYIRIPMERKKPAPLLAHQSKPLPVIPQTPPVERKTMSLPTSTPAAATPAKVDFMAILAEQAASLRKKADELDALALAIGEREQQHQGEVAKFTQLRELLKDI